MHRRRCIFGDWCRAVAGQSATFHILLRKPYLESVVALSSGGRFEPSSTFLPRGFTFSEPLLDSSAVDILQGREESLIAHVECLSSTYKTWNEVICQLTLQAGRQRESYNSRLEKKKRQA